LVPIIADGIRSETCQRRRGRSVIPSRRRFRRHGGRAPRPRLRGRTRRSWVAALLAALPLLLEPTARWLAARSGLTDMGGIATIDSPAALAEAAFGLMVTGVVFMKLARAHFRAQPASGAG
jgi:hypothetical protein